MRLVRGDQVGESPVPLDSGDERPCRRFGPDYDPYDRCP